MANLTDIFNRIATTTEAVVQDPTNLIESVEINTAYGPDILINKPLKSSGGPSPIMQLLKPMVTVRFKTGTLNPVVIAPAGKPDATKWQTVKTIGVVGSAAILYFTIKGILGKWS